MEVGAIVRKVNSDFGISTLKAFKIIRFLKISNF